MDNFEKLLKEKTPAGDSRITNGGPPATSWMRAVTSKIKISDVARKNNISTCPACNRYKVNFDDGRGFFACQDGNCKFRGNIVDFVEETGAEI